MEKKVNCLYIKHGENGKVDVFGAYMRHGVRNIEVIQSMKNVPGLGVEIFGAKYTLEYIQQKLQDHPTHNLVFKMGKSVVSWPTYEEIFLMS